MKKSIYTNVTFSEIFPFSWIMSHRKFLSSPKFFCWQIWFVTLIWSIKSPCHDNAPIIVSVYETGRLFLSSMLANMEKQVRYCKILVTELIDPYHMLSDIYAVGYIPVIELLRVYFVRQIFSWLLKARNHKAYRLSNYKLLSVYYLL